MHSFALANLCLKCLELHVCYQDFHNQWALDTLHVKKEMGIRYMVGTWYMVRGWDVLYWPEGL